MLTVVEAGELLRLGREGIYEAIHRGEIPFTRIGKRLLVPRAGLEKLLAVGSVSEAGSTHPADRESRDELRVA